MQCLMRVLSRGQTTKGNMSADQAVGCVSGPTPKVLACNLTLALTRAVRRRGARLVRLHLGQAALKIGDR